MKYGKSISLDLKFWMAVESFMKRNEIRDVSSSVEVLLEKLKELGG